MATIKAPFNFVPLSDKVFFPNWADKISQDIPFEDGVSGTIDLKITAQTPIFVRNGHTKADGDNKTERYKSFSKTDDNRYFIPATSIKGCIRNVLEIMSFGKMTQVDNASFGKRDLQDNTYTSLMRSVKCGWLYQDKDGYIIENHGTPKRISIKEVDKLLGKEEKLYKFITETDFSSDSDKLAKKKYEIIYKIKNKNVDISTKEGYENFVLSNDYLLANDNGVFVLTGQSSKRYFDSEAKKPKAGKDGKKIGCWKGKEKEFLFPNKSLGTINVEDDIFKAFETIHKDSEDYYSFWKKKLYKGQRIPVFFIVENGRLHSIGLTGLYKYPYKKSVFDVIPDNLKNPDKEHQNDFHSDLAECIFGYTFGDKALKGRVHFGHAFSIGQPTPMQEKKFVSASPHPSFYPLYTKNGYDWDMVSQIAGRKRYPIKKQVYYCNEGTTKMEQICSMLNSGTSFQTSIRFHNLRPVELGALLSAITFHKNQDKCYHSIGFGKAYGYGSVRVSGINIIGANESADFYMLEFEKAMEKEITNWKSCDQLTELLLMAKGIPQGYDDAFRYLKMSTNRNANEFLFVKNDGESLCSYSSIVRGTIVINSIKDGYISKEDEEKEKQKNIEIQQEIERRKEIETTAKEKKFKSLDFGFLNNETRFKIGWERIKKKLQDSGRDWDHEVYSQLSLDNQSLIESFCKRMISRKDSKWGSKNGDYAKQYAVSEIIKVIGEDVIKIS